MLQKVMWEDIQPQLLPSYVHAHLYSHMNTDHTCTVTTATTVTGKILVLKNADKSEKETV